MRQRPVWKPKPSLLRTEYMRQRPVWKPKPSLLRTEYMGQRPVWKPKPSILRTEYMGQRPVWKPKPSLLRTKYMRQRPVWKPKQLESEFLDKAQMALLFQEVTWRNPVKAIRGLLPTVTWCLEPSQPEYVLEMNTALAAAASGDHAATGDGVHEWINRQ